MISVEELAANIAAASKLLPTAVQAEANARKAMQQLFPREPRRLKAPRKAELYRLVRDLSEDVARLQREIERLRWWRRLMFWRTR